MKKQKQKHVAKTFRFSDDANTLLSLMSDKLGLSMTGVLELAIRDKAATMNVVLPPKETTTTTTPAPLPPHAPIPPA